MMQVVGRADELGEMLGARIPRANRELCEVQRDVLGLGMSPDEEDYVQEAIEGSERNGSGCEGESVRDCGYGY